MKKRKNHSSESNNLVINSKTFQSHTKYLAYRSVLNRPTTSRTYLWQYIRCEYNTKKTKIVLTRCDDISVTETNTRSGRH